MERLTILGVGLIGGSLARALRPFVREIVGWGRRRESLEKALSLGVIDRFALTLHEAVEGADIVVVAVPPLAMPHVFPHLRGLEEGAAVTDVGSVKSYVIRVAREAMGESFPQLVPAHPIAGSEKSGVEASSAHLFKGRRVILTPVEETSKEALEKVRDLWQKAGAEVEEMEAWYHDEVLAGTSHLPHMLAFVLMGMLAEDEEALRLSAGGLRDIARIAGSDPALWRDIALTNRKALLKAMKSFSKAFLGLEEALEARDGDRLLAYLRKGKEGWNALDQSESNEP